MALPSGVPGIAWPPIDSAQRTAMKILCEQFDQSEKWPLEQLKHFQLKRLRKLCAHAYNSVPFYKNHWRNIPFTDFDKMTFDDFEKLPTITKADIQDNHDEMQSADQQFELGPIFYQETSGSTGEPLTVMSSFLVNEMAVAYQQRWYDWCGLDGNKSMAYFTSKLLKEGEPLTTHTKHWHPNFPNGDYYVSNVALPLIEKVEWLCKVKPEYLVTYPSYTNELLHYTRENNIDMSFVEIILNYGENIIDGVKERAKDQWGAIVFNKYASREMSCMALECPETGLYHIQEENLFLEVLKEDGSVAKEGEIGKIVSTNFSSTTMPLIRYEMGDNGEVGPACSCGWEHPTLKRVLGRSRELIKLRNGDRVRPIANLKYQDAIGKIRKLQYVQTSYDDLVFKYVSDEPLDEELQKGLIKSIDAMFPVRLNITLDRVDDIPRNAGGKYDDIRCLIGD